MQMNGKLLYSMNDFWGCFILDDLVNGYYSGELEIFLRSMGETEKANAVDGITRNDGYLTVRLYQALKLNPDLTDTEIRTMYQKL